MAQSHRIERVNSALREEISRIVRGRLRDPRMPAFVTITDVKTARDFSTAQVYVSVVGSDQDKASALQALDSAQGFIKREIARAVSLRIMPALSFHIDESIERGSRILETLKVLKAQRTALPSYSYDDPRWREALGELVDASTVLITGHVNPDGDNLGSSIALALGLQALGKKVTLVNATEVPPVYRFLPLARQYTDYAKLGAAGTRFDLAVVLDSGDLERLGDGVDLRKFTARVVSFDHHISMKDCGDVPFVDQTSSSTAEIILKALRDLQTEITPEIATALLVGIVADTGSFQFECTTGKTLAAAAHLVDRGARPEAISKALFFSHSKERMALVAGALQTLAFEADGRIAVLEVSAATFAKSGAERGDLENVVNYGVSIDGVEVGLLFFEDGPQIKISFRSRGETDVQKIATAFNGGGHKKASGARFKGSLADARAAVLARVEKALAD